MRQYVSHPDCRAIGVYEVLNRHSHYLHRECGTYASNALDPVTLGQIASVARDSASLALRPVMNA
jgi:hypothetical protein